MSFLSGLLKPVEGALGGLLGAAGGANPLSMLEGGLSSMLGGGSGGGSNPLSMIESLFGGGDSIGSGNSQGGDSSGLQGLMSIASLAEMFI